MAEVNFNDVFLGKILDYLVATKSITVPKNFHTRCDKINTMLSNEVTGIINTILDFSVNSASDSKYRIECDKNENLENLLNDWLQRINISLGEDTVISGVDGLASEYFKELWKASSLCLVRLADWQEYKLSSAHLKLPSLVYLVNGSSVYVDAGDKTNLKLGKFKYALDKEFKLRLPGNKDENIIVQKPFDRWYSDYATPYLIRNGVYKNFKTVELLQDKGDSVITKALPYMLLALKGTERLALEGKVNYNDEDMKKWHTLLKEKLPEFQTETGKTPIYAAPFDTQFQHLVPDYVKAVKQELFNQSMKNILAGLGLVDVFQGVSSTRKESVLNPKPLVENINFGVKSFKSLLFSIIKVVSEKNRNDHPKLLSNEYNLEVVNSPLKINTEHILDAIRSAYDRGDISKQSYQECLGFSNRTEVRRRKKEFESGQEDVLYPQIINNQEGNTERITPSKPKTNKQEKREDEGKVPGTPENEQFKNAEDISEFVMAPYSTNEDLPKHLQYLPEGAKNIFREVFNEALKNGKGEDVAFPYAYTAMKRWLKKNGYKKNDQGKWVKE